MTYQNLTTDKTPNPSLLIDIALSAARKNVRFAAKLLRKDLRKLEKWCAKWIIKLNLEKTRSPYSPSPLSPETENPF